MSYQQFLESKIEVARESGFEVRDEDIHPSLLPHQRLAVKWAVRGGCRALFESFGLGKSLQQLEILRLIIKFVGGKGLIVAPLDVRLEFMHDARHLLGIEIQYVRTMQEVLASESSIMITNYERVRDGDIDPSYFTVATLDEASILRSFGSKTYQEFLPKFAAVPYRFVATATPSPNRVKELIHYAGYLGVMDTGQALTRFFQRDSTKANNLTLYPHKVEEFWLWVSTWALFINKPSDVGCPDDGYDLTELDIRWHELPSVRVCSDKDRDGQVEMFRDATAALSTAAREKRESVGIRIAEAAQIVSEDPGDHFILWHDTDAERDEIKRIIPAATIITGSDDLEERAENLYAFANGTIPIMATKKSISAAGGNFQKHCHRAVFVGVDHKFHDFIQAIHRIHRFLQKHPVRIDVIYTEAERGVVESLKRKWTQHDDMVERMTEIIRKYGLSTAAREKVLARSIGVNRLEVKSKWFTAVNNDCVEELAQMEENSIDMAHTSIPFSDHYEYTPSYNDFGHNEGNDRFFEQMDYLSPQLLRVLKPGRIFACHVKDRVLFGSATGTGMPEIDPFHALCIGHYMKHGFRFMGMIHVDTDVVRENNSSYRLGYTEMCKDSTKMGVGCPEYILIFRKLPTDHSTAYADEPVTRSKEDYSCARWQLDAHSHWRSSGDRLLSLEEIAELPVKDGVLLEAWEKYSRTHQYDYRAHVAFVEMLEQKGKLPKVFMIAAPTSARDDIWDDVTRMRTLNMNQQQKGREKHVCPLQLDIVERIVTRYSNPGELVLDPFAGIGTVGYVSIKLGRKAYMVELNHAYHLDSLRYLRAAEQEISTPTLFDFMEMVG